MKKRVLVLLVGVTLLLNNSVLAFAANTDGTELTVSSEPAEQSLQKELVGDLTTATQQEAIEGETDVDEDIKEEVESQIPQEYEEIRIKTADDLINLANNCMLDVWSVNKKVILEDDISLLGTDFKGIPTFGGIFDGQGHVISEDNIERGMSYTGFFGTIQKTGLVMNLSVEGNINPSGEQTFVGGVAGSNDGVIMKCNFKGVVAGHDYVGGITGMNGLTGIISGCNVDGYISGIHFTGGIAGENMGDIVKCTNDAYINTTNEDVQLSSTAIDNVNKVLDYFKRKENNNEEADKDSTTTDEGGIAGLSIGIISKCVNNGNIGYEHVGYNVGGIAGRQSGYMLECTNNGIIQGRKDVGGIVGQAEPYVTVDLSSDIAYQLSEAISKLHDIVTHTLNDAKDQSGNITSRLNTIQKFTAGAIDDMAYLYGDTIDFANGTASSANEAFSRIEYMLDEASKQDGMIDQVTYAAQDTRNAGEDLKKAVDDLDLKSYLTEEELQDYEKAQSILNSSGNQYSENYTKAYRAYYNHEIANEVVKLVKKDEYGDMVYVFSDGSGIYGKDELKANDWDNVSTPKKELKGDIDVGITKKGEWYHRDPETGELKTFPQDNDDDTKLQKEAMEDAAKDAQEYAQDAYQSPVNPGNDQKTDLLYASAVYAELLTRHYDEMSEATRTDAKNGLDNLDSAVAHVQTASEQAKEVVGYIAGKDPITFPQFSDEYRLRSTSLTNNLQGMNDNFGLLNGEVDNANGVLVDDLQAMADQFNVIMMLYTDAIDGVLDADYTTAFEDVSLTEAEDCVDATIDRCVNYGEVSGDIDCAGVAGTMAIEYDYDLESDVTGIKSSKLNTSYITKCVLRDSKNYGNVSGEKSYIGGVCGLQEMGTILGSSNFSNVKSSSGEYVGGVAGSSLSYVVSSFSKGILEGKNYVGGIAGDALNVRNSYSLVDIQNAEGWYGAIVGHVSDNGEIRNNYYVSDSLAGVDRISYAKKAEPIEYKDSLKSGLFGEDLRNVPYDFNYLNVTFMLEDEDDSSKTEIIKTVKKKYGESLTFDEYPELEGKEGFYVCWDIDSIDCLHTDKIVTAKYTRFRTTLSEVTPGNDFYQSKLLIDGDFKEEDVLVVTRSNTVDPAQVGLTTKEMEDIDCFETIDVEIPDDGLKFHQLRISPESAYRENTKNFTLYQVTDTGKVLLEPTGTMGKYYTYAVEGNKISLLVNYEEKNDMLFIIAIVVAAVLGLIALIILTVIFAKRHGRKLPGFVNNIYKKVVERIERKEQIFYDESKDDDQKVS